MSAPDLMDLPTLALSGRFSRLEVLMLLFVVIGAATYVLNLCMSHGDLLVSKWESTGCIKVPSRSAMA